MLIRIEGNLHLKLSFKMTFLPSSDSIRIGYLLILLAGWRPGDVVSENHQSIEDEGGVMLEARLDDRNEMSVDVEDGKVHGHILISLG